MDAVIIILIAFFLAFRSATVAKAKAAKMPPVYTGYSDYRDENAFLTLFNRLMGVSK